MDELTSDFVAETNDNLDDLHADLIALETAPNTEHIAKIFRFFHTVKGSCSFLNFKHLEKLAHNAEDLLAKLDTNASITPHHITLIYDSINAIKSSIDAIEQNGVETECDHDELIKRLNTPYDDKTTVSAIRRIYDTLSAADKKKEATPLSEAFKKLPAVIDDLNKKLNKTVALSIKGGNVQCPALVVEKLKAPLLHMVRNAVDHGIESPDKRKNIGKDETGTINIVATSEDNHVIIKISDDGQGIDEQALKEDIISHGLITNDAVNNLSRQDLLQFIFKPGISSADQISHTSGRGVGMDVVYTNIVELNGTIEVETIRGNGCCFTIKIPY